MKCFNRIFFFFAIALLLPGLPLGKTLNLYAQNTGTTTSTGLKYFKNYTPLEYKGHNQNWAILEDKRGIIYVANSSGIKEFDGVSWLQIDVPNSTVYSMAIDDAGIIYVGGKDEFGFLTPGPNGSLQYKSLVHHLAKNKRNFGDVWRTHSTKEGIYFSTSKFLFRCDPNSKEIKIYKPEKPGYSFKASFICKEKLFIRQENVGLIKMDSNNDSLEMVPGGETFADKKIYMMVQYPDQDNSHKLLIGTQSNGLYIYDGIKLLPFPTGVDHYLQEKELSHGIRLTSGDFALATGRGGLVIMDAHGRLIEIFNRAYGLQNEKVRYVFQDSSGNLWLCLDKGISKIEYGSPISIYDEESNLPVNVQTVVKHQSHLYAGTSSGLFLLASPRDFRPAAGISSHCWSLLSIEDSLLAATTDGVFQVESNRKQRITKNRAYVLMQSPKDAHRIWVGTSEGLVSLYLKNKNANWEKEYKFENITQKIRTIVEDPEGNLWLGTRTQGVLKVDFPGNRVNEAPGVIRYHTSHGLPEEQVGVYIAAEHVMFATNEGIFRFDKKKKTFIPDSTLGKEFAGGPEGTWVFRIREDKNKNIWLYSDAGKIQAIPLADGTYEPIKKPFLRIPKSQVNAIYLDPDGANTWFAANDGLFRYDTRIEKNYLLEFQTLIRKVLVNGKLIFDGYKYKINNDSKSQQLFPVIDYKDRNLRFQFAAPFFEGETSTLYQCFLQGHEKDWSDLSSETWKDYTNLDAGVYTFRVRARNVYENLSTEAVFKFKILLPWYRKWWAFLTYAFVLFMLTYLITKWWRSIKLEHEKQKLEQIVKERTKEIKEKNLQLEEQSEKLKELDKMKSRFFANISHEFRTPLTLIMGPLDRIRSHSLDLETKKQVGLVYRSAQRLLGLINQLLDLSKFESGKMKLTARQEDLVPFLKTILETFETMAARQRLSLTFHTAAPSIPLFFDKEKLEKIFINLLSNACKFTPAGGRIIVSATFTTAANETVETPPEAGGFVNISVKDTGTGIPGDQLVHIFDRFYQADITVEHHGKGSGIGLALVKELVDLHHGEITVHSSIGANSGTEFILRLPLGSSHLAAGEIVETQKSSEKTLHKEEMQPFAPLETLEPESDDLAAAEGNDFFRQLQADRVPGKNIILVVEDSADMRKYIRDTLEPDYTVEEAKNGREGIEKARSLVPDLIISDIMMPEADGYELCRTVKSDLSTSHIPVVLLTAKASEENILQGLETRADDYITKPFNIRVLCARIHNLIELRRQLQMKLSREMVLQPSRIAVSEMDREFLKDLQSIIEKNLSDPDFNVEDMSKRLYMSRTSVYRKILALSGETPTDFIRSYRLMRAAQLLKSQFGSITEVAFEVGFSSRAYFTKCFKEKFHQLPSDYISAESS